MAETVGSLAYQVISFFQPNPQVYYDKWQFKISLIFISTFGGSPKNREIPTFWGRPNNKSLTD